MSKADDDAPTSDEPPPLDDEIFRLLISTLSMKERPHLHGSRCRWRLICAFLVLVGYCISLFVGMGASLFSRQLKPLREPTSILATQNHHHYYGSISSSSSYRLVPETSDPLPGIMVNKAFSSKQNHQLPFLDDDLSFRIKACPVTTQLRFHVDDWMFETLTETGKSKSVGGDEFYIVYQDEAVYASASESISITAVARWSDHQNGTYSVEEFVMSPYLSSDKHLSGKGRLLVYLTHTCGVGRIGRPHKDNWATGGGVNVRWVLSNIAAPPMAPFQPPSSSIDFATYDRILGVGDSTMQQFVSSTYLKWFYPNLRYGKNMRNPLQTRTVDDFLGKIRKRLKPWMAEKGLHAALLIGSSSWDLLKPFGNEDVPIPGFPNEEEALLEDHKNAIRTLIATVKKENPNVDIYWRSGSAMHLHTLVDGLGSNWTDVERTHYLSQYRVERLFHVQKELMKELNVTFLDLYHGSYLMADHHRSPGDSMHFDVSTNQMMISWFYPNGFVESSYGESKTKL
jgi:hypothetical protein